MKIIRVLFLLLFLLSTHGYCSPFFSSAQQTLLGFTFDKSIFHSSLKTLASAFALIDEKPFSTSTIFPPLKRIIRQGENLFQILRELGIPTKDIQPIVTSAFSILKPRQIQANMPILVFGNSPIPGTLEPERIEIRLDPLKTLIAKKEGEGWKAKLHQSAVTKLKTTYTGVIKNSFWNSAIETGMLEATIVDFAEIFSSLVDFERESRTDDRWRLVVEENISDGIKIGAGQILAAEIANQKNVHTAVFHKTPELKRNYYTPEGKSVSRLFLKSPLKFGRITSRFSRNRFHPVLKQYRRHQGIDYGAPTGTPVRSVGNGTVAFAGWLGGGGKTIKVTHNSRYKTAYKHLSRFASGIRPGAPIEIGQVIGYSGKTGLVSGPHLHFEFWSDDRFVDPLSMSFPSADPLPHKYMTEFQNEAQKILKELPPWKTDLL